MNWTWSLVTGPVDEPLSLDDAKAHARITHAREDGLVVAYVQAARQACEQYTNRALLTQTWKLQLCKFPVVVSLPMAAPLQNDDAADPSTAVVVQYYDADGTLQTLDDANYIVDTASTPGSLERAPNVTWPTVQSDRQYPVVITYVCGYADVGDVPELLKHGMRMWIAAMDADRLGGTDESRVRSAARACWEPFQCVCPDPQWC